MRSLSLWLFKSGNIVPHRTAHPIWHAVLFQLPQKASHNVILPEVLVDRQEDLPVDRGNLGQQLISVRHMGPEFTHIRRELHGCPLPHVTDQIGTKPPPAGLHLQ